MPKEKQLFGANIIEKGTTNGTITDIDGRFTLVVSEKSSLVFFLYRLSDPRNVGREKNVSECSAAGRQ